MDRDHYTKATYRGTKDFTQQQVKTANATGFGAAADDYSERGIDLNEQLVRNKPATYFFRMKGDAMREAGIFDGDMIGFNPATDFAFHGIFAGVSKQVTDGHRQHRFRRLDDDVHQDARHPHVNAIDGAAVALGRDVKTLERLADQRLLGGLGAYRRRGDAAIGEAGPGDLTVLVDVEREAGRDGRESATNIQLA